MSACLGKHFCTRLLVFTKLLVLENKFYKAFDIAQKLFPLDAVSFH